MAVNGGQATIAKIIPHDVADIMEYWEGLAVVGKGHISGVDTVASDGSLRVRLSTPTTTGGDMKFLVKKAKLAEAKTLVERLVSNLDQGMPPSDSETRLLFSLLELTPH